jgi:hypothetical protein
MVGFEKLLEPVNFPCSGAVPEGKTFDQPGRSGRWRQEQKGIGHG